MDTNKSTEAIQTTQIYCGLCPQCEDSQVSTKIQEREYVYGTGESAVKLDVKIPVHTCNNCELEFSDWKAEEIKHNALCQHFGVLNPNQIKQLRKKYKLSRSAFAQLTGLGEASLNRWEKGINIQSIAHDRYLRLLDNRSSLIQLKRTVSKLELRDSVQQGNVRRFRNLKNQKELEMEQSWFELRPAA